MWSGTPGYRLAFNLNPIKIRLIFLQVQPVRFPVTRIRLDGSIPGPDQERVENICESGEDPVACDMVKFGFNLHSGDSSDGTKRRCVLHVLC